MKYFLSSIEKKDPEAAAAGQERNEAKKMKKAEARETGEREREGERGRERERQGETGRERERERGRDDALKDILKF